MAIGIDSSSTAIMQPMQHRGPPRAAPPIVSQGADSPQPTQTAPVKPASTSTASTSTTGSNDQSDGSLSLLA